MKRGFAFGVFRTCSAQGLWGPRWRGAVVEGPAGLARRRSWWPCRRCGHRSKCLLPGIAGRFLPGLCVMLIEDEGGDTLPISFLP